MDNSVLIMKNAFLQAESIGAQKLRRLHNLSSLYNRLYGSQYLLELLQTLSKKFKNPGYIIGGAILTNTSRFDWKKERLSELELKDYYKEIDVCNELRLKTITCKTCGSRLRYVLLLYIQ